MLTMAPAVGVIALRAAAETSTAIALGTRIETVTEIVSAVLGIFNFIQIHRYRPQLYDPLAVGEHWHLCGLYRYLEV